MASPDAATKVNIFFEAAGGTSPTGWTETFWSSITDVQDLADKIKSVYVPKRKALLGVGCSIQFIRASKIPPNRVTAIRYLVHKEGTPDLFTNSPADDYDPTQVDLLLRVEDSIGKRRQWWLGGLPDSQTDQLLAEGINGAFVNSPAFKQLVQAITTIGLGIRSIATKGTPNTYQFNQIVRIQPIMVRNRKRGRPFDLFRGKRLA